MGFSGFISMIRAYENPWSSEAATRYWLKVQHTYIYIYIELQIKEMMEFNAGFLTDVFQNFRGDYWIITLL